MTISIAVEIQHRNAPAPKRYVGFRGLHWLQEGGRPVAQPGMPAVIPPYNPTVALNMTESIQRMSYALVQRFCSAVDGKRWRVLHGQSVAMNNKAGNGFGDIPLRDYVNGIDLNAPGLPRYDKMQRTFQGSFISGRLEGNVIWCTPGVDAIDATKPLPSVDEIAEKGWFSVAICTGTPPFHFRSQWGSTCWIAYPFILDRPVSFEAKFFGRWDETFLPDPLKIYN